MSAESVTQLCNMALARIGHQKPLTDFTSDTTTAGDIARLFYANTRDQMLRSHPWNFAIKRVALAASTSTPNHEYDYAFPLPDDCLRVIRTSWEATGWSSRDEAVKVFWSEPGYPYRIEQNQLLTNESSVSIEYIARIEDTSQFDPMFTDCLVQRLAAEFSQPLADNATLTKNLWDIYNQKMSEARVMDAQEGSARDVVDNSGWVQARV